MATPKRVRKTASGSISLSYSKLSDVIAELIRERKRLTKEGWLDLEIDMQSEPYSHSDREYPYIVGMRMETMEEAEKREANEAESTREREERDRQTYAALQKKFG